MKSDDPENGQIGDPGGFRIAYVWDRISPYSHYVELPLCAEVRIGGVDIGYEGTNRMCAGRSFMLDLYIDMIRDLQRGEKQILVFDYEKPIPIRFQPAGESCRVGLVKERVGTHPKIAFDKAAVWDQWVRLDDVVFQLADVANRFLANVRDSRAWGLLDDLEAVLGDYPDGLGWDDMFKKRDKVLFHFDRAASLDRSMRMMAKKKKMYGYKLFMERLGCHEQMIYQMLGQSLALAYPGKSPEELYALVNLSQHETPESVT